MSHKEKENLISLISTTLVMVPYILYIFARYRNENMSSEEELKYWATAILFLIPIRIVVQIVIHILYYILRAIVTGRHDNESELSDERDKIIDLKGDFYATNAFVLGVLIAMVVVVAGGSLSAMFGIIILSGFLGEIIGIIFKICYYRMGLKL